MAQPTEDIVLIATSATGADGYPNKTAPSAPITTLGWGAQDVAYENLNHLFNNQAQWLIYLKTTVEELKTQIERERIPIGGTLEITDVGTNPSVLLGYGSWVRHGNGRVTVGVGTATDDRGVSKTWTVAQEEGEYEHVQTQAEMFRHDHNVSVSIGNDTHYHSIGAGNGSGSGIVDSASDTSATANTDPDTHNHPATVTESLRGGTAAANNIQPSVAVYRWKRVA